MTVGAKPGTSGVPILHDPFSLGTAGQVRSHVRKRTGAVRWLGQRLGLRRLSRTSCSVACSKFLAPPRAGVSQLTG